MSLFNLSLTQYVDDFPQVETRASAESALACEAVLALLGWEVKQAGGKTPAFEQSFVALGVEYDMHAAERDVLVIRDKRGRHEKVEELVSKIVEEDEGCHSMLHGLRGLRTFQGHNASGDAELKPADIDALLFWPRFLQTSRPREVRVHDSRPPVIIMTDGPEEEYVGVGAVLYDPVSAKKEFFGGAVMDTEVGKWKDVEGTTRVIHQSELFPILLAARLWSCILANRLVFVFVDNDGAKGSMVNGTSMSRASAQIVHACWTQLSTSVGSTGCRPAAILLTTRRAGSSGRYRS